MGAGPEAVVDQVAAVEERGRVESLGRPGEPLAAEGERGIGGAGDRFVQRDEFERAVVNENALQLRPGKLRRARYGRQVDSGARRRVRFLCSCIASGGRWVGTRGLEAGAAGSVTAESSAARARDSVGLSSAARMRLVSSNSAGGRLAISGSTCGSRFVSRSRWSATARLGSRSMRRISMPMRSALTVLISAAISWIAASVAGSISKSNVAAKRTARSMRSLSSLRRKRGSPMARMMRASRSCWPPT